MAKHLQTHSKHAHSADNYWQIPTMGDQRLRYLSYQVVQKRKSTQMLNDRLRDSNIQFTKVVDRERKSNSIKWLQDTTLMKKQLIEIRGLQEVLKEKRELTVRNHTLSSPYGRYHGESVESYKRDIARIIHDGRPQLRRFRKVQKLKSDGRLQGKIVNYGEKMKQLMDVLSKSNDKVYESNENNYLRVISRTSNTHSCQSAVYKFQMTRQDLSQRELTLHRLNSEFRREQSNLMLIDLGEDFYNHRT